MSCEHPAPKRQWLEAYPGGMLYFLGCHLIDLILTIQGVPENIIPLSTCIGQEGVTANDFGMAVFQYKNGVSFAKTTAMEVGGLERRQIVVCGTKGTIEIKPIEWYPEAGSSGMIARVHQVHRDELTDINWGRPADNHDTAPFERYESMIRGFASYVRGEAKNPYSYEHELLLHKVLLAACGVETDYKNFSL